jgi:hypothetical protein
MGSHVAGKPSSDGQKWSENYKIHTHFYPEDEVSSSAIFGFQNE